MTAADLFTLGVKFRDEGKTDLAMELWHECMRVDPFFNAVYPVLYQLYRAQNNLLKAKESLIRWLNCPVTGMTIDMVPRVRKELEDLDKQLQASTQAPPATIPALPIKG